MGYTPLITLFVNFEVRKSFNVEENCSNSISGIVNHFLKDRNSGLAPPAVRSRNVFMTECRDSRIHNSGCE